ncbi:lactosylceramide 4-alpha-galactosyltransferase-like isoform X1 [Palaemon carinicauda]|uniref:lactosylceramide 4-alpha-galactosyltransferase-like isoform X1 n=2 Tax=Palaemon carinicauda TaxID=392227 RepID=UPI0035B665D3
MTDKPCIKLLAIIILATCLIISLWTISLDYRMTRDVAPSKTVEILVPWKKQYCAGDSAYSTGSDTLQNLPLMQRVMTPKVSSENIFLIESTCSPHPLYRSWCSVESWAAQHPEKTVWFILVSPFLDDVTGVRKSLFSQYSNIRIVTSNLEEIFSETPLWELFNSDKWLRGTSWAKINLSDMLRVALVWKWGGIYADTDSICIRSTSNLTDAVGMESDSRINNAILIGQPRHKVFRMLMEDIQKNFRGDIWGAIGPQAITRVMNELCKTNNFVEIAKNDKGCANMTVLPIESLYPIPYQQYKKYTEDGKETDLAKLFNSSYTLHFWNKLTMNTPVSVKGHSILITAAKTFCPVTYNIATSNSNFY